MKPHREMQRRMRQQLLAWLRFCGPIRVLREDAELASYAAAPRREVAALGPIVRRHGLWAGPRARASDETPAQVQRRLSCGLRRV